MERIFFLFVCSISFSILMANDNYMIKYNGKSKKCFAYKNNKEISLIDKKFKSDKVTTPYTCLAIQVENYRGCRIKNGSEHITAYAFSFGSYGEKTKFMVGYKVAVPYVDAFLKLECSKEHFNF
ncbi:hypothetical protein [Sulfurimonas autotrophica]|nr:hypothetical protein [Sulfurimonas autotrophica]